MARRALSVGAALITAAGIFSASPVASAAPSLATAKQQAATLAAQLSHLNDEAELASEDADAANEALGKAVTTYLGAQNELAEDQARDSAALADQTNQAVALYEAGGPTNVYAAALDGQDLGDVVDRISMAGNVLAGAQNSGRHQAAQTARLAALNTKLDKAAQNQSHLRVQAALKTNRLQYLIGQQRQLLAAANTQVVTISRQLQEAAQKKAAEAFATKLAAAQALANSQAQLFTGATAPTAAAGQAILAAQSRIGTPYVWGAVGPGSFDCSGLTGWAYAQAGIALPRTSREQWFVGHHVGLADLQPGDLLFWALDTSNPATIHHVALYIGNDEMIAAPHTGADVSIQQVYLNGFIGATRPTG